ncbi:phage holin family protein [Helicobacter sp. MIT 21-1697]|uniref:phage holin family protein n=1 Tax=Helicobacter sp. MIT 21-1697 TaxID=2993733 RepID=UPI00224B1DA6|nr:phage holin family protein [Helicobacter sp. MIT 21-1697]MCX2717817.1 phage holin family protein [Helicobacter sp. MIT 21-1697]
MIEHYIELLPIALVGILAGIVSFFNEESQEQAQHRSSLKVALKSLLTSSFLCVIVYAVLSATDLPYLARVGISAAIGFFGVEKAISLAKELLAFKNGRSKGDTQ